MSAPIEPGTILAGKFRVDQILGQGGMGVVVAAHHLHLDEAVAIKFLLPHALANPDAVARFAQEARASVKIKSEHVARVSDVGTLENGAPYIVMERLIGSDLGAIVFKRGQLSVEDAVDYVLQASEAVAEAHALGIVHRDLKPANLYLIHRADGSPCVKVLDFGISKVMGPAGQPLNSGLTQSSVAMGSPHYMSPEQLTSSRDVDARTDIWALGAILYELLGGRPPFHAESFAELCTKVLMTRPESLRALNPSVPPELEEIILSALERDRGRRIPNVAELAQRIVKFAPRQSRISADRISKVLQAAGLGGTAMAPGPSTDPAPPPTGSRDGTLPQGVAPSAGYRGSSPSGTLELGPSANPAFARSGVPALAQSGAASQAPVPPQSGTMGGLGQTVAGKRKSTVWIATLVGAGIAVAGGFALTRSPGPGPAVPSATSASTAVSPPGTKPSASASVVAPEVAPSNSGVAMPIEPEITAAPEPSAIPVVPSANVAPSAKPIAARLPPPGTRPRPTPSAAHSAKPVEPAPPKPAVTKPNCDPNYYFDKQGEKHFKPECF